MRDWTELKRLAGEATHGDWERDGSEVGPVWDQNASIAKCSKREDAAFIAVANPQAILALIAENERLRNGECPDCDGTGDIHDLAGEWRGECRRCNVAENRAVTLERDQLRAEVDGLRTLLTEAAEDIADWGAYAGEYFQQKHDLAGCVARYRAALDKGGQGNG